MRKQYYFRPSERGLLAWDVDRLIVLTRHFPRIHIALTAIRELNEAYWHGDDDTAFTWRTVLEHARLIAAADLSFPIILSSDGHVMDGMHRVGKAVLEGRTTIEAVQFTHDPEPDHVGVHPSELRYEDDFNDPTKVACRGIVAVAAARRFQRVHHSVGPQNNSWT